MKSNRVNDKNDRVTAEFGDFKLRICHFNCRNFRTHRFLETNE